MYGGVHKPFERINVWPGWAGLLAVVTRGGSAAAVAAPAHAGSRARRGGWLPQQPAVAHAGASERERQARGRPLQHTEACKHAGSKGVTGTLALKTKTGAGQRN